MLPDLWRDLVSLFGFVATLAGLWYAIRQIRLTKTAAVAAKEAALRAVEGSKSDFQRYAVANAQRFFHEAIIQVDIKAWDMASIRLHDLADQIAQLAKVDPESRQLWQALTETAREQATTMKRVAGNEIKPQHRKWEAFKANVRRQFDVAHGPFGRLDQEEER